MSEEAMKTKFREKGLTAPRLIPAANRQRDSRGGLTRFPCYIADGVLPRPEKRLYGYW